MDWKSFWDRQARESNHPQAQVGRIRKGKIAQPEEIHMLIEHIVEMLDLQEDDHLLDVCCGNGFLTHRLAQKCRHVTGVDISPAQIALARKQHSAPNIQYQTADATQLAQKLSTSFDKINLHFSFQYLDSFKKGNAAISGMAALLKPGGKIFLGDVPDRRYYSNFYPSPLTQIRETIKSFLGKNDMGKFWSESEIQKIGNSLGLEAHRLEQAPHFPYSSYRSDYLLIK